MKANRLPDFDDTSIAFQSRTTAELKRAQALFYTLGSPRLSQIGALLTETAFQLHLPISPVVRNTVFAQFCGGEAIDECQTKIDELANFGIDTILDYSVEGGSTEQHFDETCEEIGRIIAFAGQATEIPFAVFKGTGIADPEVLRRASSGTLTRDDKSKYDRFQARVAHLCQLAADHQTRIMIDAEESWIQPALDEIALTMMRTFNRDRAVVYNTVQLYRHDRLTYLQRLHREAEGIKLGLKLVRGAYMEKERDWAQAEGQPIPIYDTKDDTDAAFDRALQWSIERIDRVEICCGSHNEASCLKLAELMANAGIDVADDRIYFAQLLGMSDHISYNLAHYGYNVAKYVPYGPVREVMPYLIRRAEENRSISGQVSRELSLIKKELTRRGKDTNEGASK